MAMKDFFQKLIKDNHLKEFLAQPQQVGPQKHPDQGQPSVVNSFFARSPDSNRHLCVYKFTTLTTKQ